MGWSCTTIRRAAPGDRRTFALIRGTAVSFRFAEQHDRGGARDHHVVLHDQRRFADSRSRALAQRRRVGRDQSRRDHRRCRARVRAAWCVVDCRQRRGRCRRPAGCRSRIGRASRAGGDGQSCRRCRDRGENRGTDARGRVPGALRAIRSAAGLAGWREHRPTIACGIPGLWRASEVLHSSSLESAARGARMLREPCCNHTDYPYLACAIPSFESLHWSARSRSVPRRCPHRRCANRRAARA